VDEQEAPVGTPETTVAADENVSAVPKKPKVDIAGNLVLLAGAGALLWGLISAVGTGWGFWAYTSGLKGVTWAFFLALGALLVGIVRGRMARKSISPPPRTRRWAGMLLVGGVVAGSPGAVDQLGTERSSLRVTLIFPTRSQEIRRDATRPPTPRFQSAQQNLCQ